MLNDLVFKYWEISGGRVLPSLFEETTGVSARTLRKKKTVSKDTLEKAANNSKEYLINGLREAGNTEAEIKKHIDGHPESNNSGMLYSGLIYESQVKGVMKFPKTIVLAEKIDSLSSELYKAKESNDLELFKTNLLNSARDDNCFWILDEESESYLSGIETAKNWDDLHHHLSELKYLTIISLLSHWDIEFCTQYFESYELRPMFVLVLPKSDPAIGEINTGDTIEKRRDMYWLPVRRLISLLACMNEYLKNDCWPDEVPSVRKFSIFTSEVEQNLVNWRDGTKKYTYRNFSSLWDGVCRDNRNGELVSDLTPPIPIFVSTKFWEMLLVKKIKGKVNEVVLIEDDYCRYWEWHKNKYKTNQSANNKKEWPSCFDKI